MSYIAVIAGARPNFMKVGPLMHALEVESLPAKLIHTGQHYDKNMSDCFFKELDIPEPSINLEIGSGSHAQQTARIMMAFEKICLEDRPELIVVVGDVNSTVACSLVGAKLGIKICHLEAGLRSFDWQMPEEINRVVTDRLSDILLTPSPDADHNLLKEGVPESKIFRVGNIMIDTLLRLLPRTAASHILNDLNIESKKYILGTFHRPANVDTKDSLNALVSILLEASEKLTVVIPLHPRTISRLRSYSLIERLEKNPQIIISKPLGYIDFLALNKNSLLVMTDSGGIQEETTVLGIPCLTLRENTERPITISEGSNKLVGLNKSLISQSITKIIQSQSCTTRRPELWDGKTAERCVQVIKKAID